MINFKLFEECVRDSLLDDLFDMELVNKDMSLKKINTIVDYEMEKSGLNDMLKKLKANYEDRWNKHYTNKVKFNLDE